MSGLWSTLTDGMPSESRRVASIYGIGCGVLLLVAIQLGLILKMISVTEVVYQVGSITFTGSSLAISCTSNIIIFWTRNVMTAIRDPASLTVIKSNVKSEKVSKVEARVWYAAFHLKEAARHLQERGTQDRNRTDED